MVRRYADNPDKPDSDSPEPTKKAKPRPNAYDKALGLLARREHSRRELGRKLDQVGYAPEESGDALAKLGDQRYQNDGRFGQMLVRSRVNQGYGPMRIQMELRSHGLDNAAIRQLLDAAEVDWDALAQRQLQRHYAGRLNADRAERQRQAQYLQRRGFSSASIRAASRVSVDDADLDESVPD